MEYVKDIPQRCKFDENLQVYFADVDGKGKAYIYIFNDDTYGAVTIPDIYSIEEKEAIGKQFFRFMERCLYESFCCSRERSIT